MTDPSEDTYPPDDVASARSAAWASESVITADTTMPEQMGKVFGYLKGMHATHLIKIGVDAGLFRALGRSSDGLFPEALAEQLNLDPNYLRGFCETACALELLDYDPASGYRLAPFMDEILGDPDGTFYLGGFPGLHLTISRDYPSYPEHFASGGVNTYQDHDEAFSREVAEATRTLPRMFLSAVLPDIPGLEAQLDGGASILDVGCGGGYAVVEFAQRFPAVRCVGVDPDADAIAMAQQLIRSLGLGDRVQAHRVDASTLPSEFDEAFDLVTSFLVLHEIHPGLKESVLRQAARALRPGGRLLLFDERFPSTPAELRDPTQIYAVMAQWYELTWGNVLNTSEEINALLVRAGLEVVNETSLSRFYIVTAEKPA